MTTEVSDIEVDLSTHLEPGRRPEIEHDLDDVYHVKWEFVPGVRPSQFNKDKSLKNQARFQAIDQPTVDNYTACMLRGDDFPAVLAYSPALRERLVIIGGNHRLLASIAAEKLLNVYEIDRETHPRTIALLTYADNTKHGRPTSEEERTHQAIWLVDNGASVEHAAMAVAIPTRVLRKALAKAKVDERAKTVGLRDNEWDNLSVTVKTRLGAVSTDEGFRAAAMLAFAAKLDANEVFELVPQLNATSSSKQQEALVKDLRDLHQNRIQAGGGGILRTAGARAAQGPKTRMNMALGQLMALPDDPEAIARTYAIPERVNAAKKMREAADRLNALADLLAPLPK